MNDDLLIAADDAPMLEIAEGLFDVFGQKLDGLLERLERADWEESQHPRGQPQNKGQFVKGAGSAEGMTVGKAGEGQFVAQVNGDYAAHAAVTPGQPFLSSLHVHEGHKGKGIGHALHEHIEEKIGRKLVPNPLHMDDDQKEWWKKRLAEMDPKEAKALLTEAREIGSKKFGRKQTDIDKLHMPLREVVGGGQHPGAGYSQQSYVDGSGRIHTSNVEDAARALYEKREVVLSQPREVATLIEHLGKVSAQMISMGGKAPVFDLCKVSIAGTNLFCAESKGIPRVKMPQLDREKTKQFRHFLEAKGYKITREKEDADKLRATQDELNGAKVAINAAAYDAGKEARRIIVSKDNYILDGHHKWAATLGRDARDNKLGDTKMKISRVNASITDLLKETENFGAMTGQSVGAGTPAATAGEGEVKKGTKGYEFVSPNEKDLKFKEAIEGLEGERHKYIAAMAEDVDKELGIKGKVKKVVGVWADGAENSTMTVVKNPTWDKLVSSAAMKGHLANQKQVLIFNEGDEDATHGDASFLASFEVKGDLKEVSDYLGKNGLTYHTLEPTKHGAIVHVYGSDDDTMFAVAQAGGHYGSEVEASHGRGAFLGTQKQDGTDDEQREDARAAYEREIEGSGYQSSRAVWARLRDRYGRQGKASGGGEQVARGDAALIIGQRPKRMLQIVRADFNPNQPRIPAGEPGGGQWMKGEGGGAGDLGFKKDDKASNDSMTIWRHPTGILKVQNATGAWKWAGGDGSTDVGPNEKSLNSFLYSKKEELAPKPEPAEGEEAVYEPEPEVVEVGGDEWNRKTAQTLEEEFVGVGPALDKIAREKITSGELEVPEEEKDPDDEEEAKFIPEEWDQLNSDLQEQTKQKWIKANLSDFIDSEEESWRDNGGALEEAKRKMVNDFDNADETEWATEAINEFKESWNDEHPDDKLTYSTEDLLNALSLTGNKNDDFGGEGRDDPNVDWDRTALGKPEGYEEPDPNQMEFPGMAAEPLKPGQFFTDDMESDLNDAIVSAFNKKADDVSGDIDPPDYIKESAEESADDYFDQYEDETKFKAAKDYLDSDVFEENEAEEKVPDEAVTVDQPPKHYDPLNANASMADYKKTQAIVREMSYDRATALIKQRNLLKDFRAKDPVSTESVAKALTEAQAGWQEGITDEALKTMMMHNYGVEEVKADSPANGHLLSMAYGMLYSAPVENVAHGGDWTTVKAGSGINPNDAEAMARVFATKLVHAADLSDKHVTFHQDIIDKELSPNEKAVFDKYREKISSDMASTFVNHVERQEAAAGVSDEDMKSRVKRFDSQMWSAWKQSSTSPEGKMMQIATAEELHGRVRLPGPPEIKPEPIREATDLEVINNFGKQGTTENADLRAAIQHHLNAAVVSAKNLRKLPADGYSASLIPQLVQAHLKLGIDRYGATSMDYDWDAMEPKEVEAIKAIQPQLEAAIRSGITQRREDMNAVRREGKLNDAIAKYGGYEPKTAEQYLEFVQGRAQPPIGMTTEIEHYLDANDMTEFGKAGVSTRLAVLALASAKVADGKVTVDLPDLAKQFTSEEQYGDEVTKQKVRDFNQKLAVHKSGLEATMAAVFKRNREDHDRLSKASAKEVYNNEKNNAWETKPELIKQADEMFSGVGGYEGLKAMIRAKWETTQWALKKAGIKELNLYRAVVIPKLKETPTATIKGRDGRTYTKLTDAEIIRAGAASTSTDAKVSNGWNGSERIVLRMKVPRTAALSVPAYGINVHSEREVVVSGTAWKHWDAYRTTAPDFDMVPIEEHAHVGTEGEQEAEEQPIKMDYGFSEAEKQELGMT